MSLRKQKIILDVDTGSDDALAILFAIKSKRIRILGITTVAGNTNLGQVTINTLKVLDLAEKLDTPVFKGNSRPLKGKGRRARTQGQDGLCEVTLPLPNKTSQKLKAEDFIIETISNYPKKIIIVATGPLTNLAQVFRKKPAIKEKINRIIIMGGAVEVPGNVTSCAEFNFFNDPKAVKIVFESGVPITLIPLDVTMKLLMKRRWLLKEYGGSKNSITKFIVNLANNRWKLLGKDWFYLHDPLVIGVAINKNFVKTKKEKFRVITQGKEKGCIVKDPEGSEIEWAFDVKTKDFLGYFEKQLLR